MTMVWKKSVLHNQVAENEKIGICIPIGVKNLAQFRQDLRLIQQCPHNLVEWRVDYYQEVEEPGWYQKPLELIEEMLPGCPILVTYRTGNDQIEAELITRLIQTGKPQLIDLRLEMADDRRENLMKQAREKGIGVVVSHHDFLGTPNRTEMVSLLLQMAQTGADLVKLAVMPTTAQDVTDLTNAAKDYTQRPNHLPMIAISMGELGQRTRIMGKEIGSCMTFAAAGCKTAPGQIDAVKLQNIWNNDEKTINVDNFKEFRSKAAKK